MTVLRSFYVTKAHARLLPPDLKKKWERILSGQEKQQQGRAAWKALDDDTRADVASVWCRLTNAPAYVQQMIDKKFSKADAIEGLSRRRGQGQKGVLLTWIHNDNFVDVDQLACTDEPTASLQELVQDVRNEPLVKEAWEEVRLLCKRCAKASGAVDVAACLEVCPDTWRLQGVLRLHTHMFLKSSSLGSLHMPHTEEFEFCTSMPHASTAMSSVQASSSTRGSSWAGFFYCCLQQKIGTVFCESTKAPFTGFLVNPGWILNMVQSVKLDAAVARELLVRCGNSSRHLKELQVTETELERLAVTVAVKQAAQELGSSLKEWKTYELVTEFQAQFLQTRHRYKFLVLSGPSRLGKTVFASSICPTTLETLELNCAAGTEPDLRAYRLSRHGLLLFDEIRAEQVMAQRKLFQAQSAPVQLGCSATNCYSYEVFVWRKPFVLCSNTWHASVAKLNQMTRNGSQQTRWYWTCPPQCGLAD